MSTPTDLSPAIQQAAQSPRTVTADGLSVSAVPIPEQIAADRYAASKAARASKYRGMMFTKILPAAAMPDQQGTFSGVSTNFDSPGGVV